MTFTCRKYMLEWVRNKANKLRFSIVITRSDNGTSNKNINFILFVNFVICINSNKNHKRCENIKFDIFIRKYILKQMLNIIKIKENKNRQREPFRDQNTNLLNFSKIKNID